MKNVIVGLLSLIIIALMINTASIGGAFQGGSAGIIIEDFKDTNVEIKTKVKKDEEKLKSLKEKAGTASNIEVSINYRTKCSACHGVNGQGILGPNLFNKSSDEIFQALIDYKSGRKENVVMKGLLMNINETEMKELSDEIGLFKSKLQ